MFSHLIIPFQILSGGKNVQQSFFFKVQIGVSWHHKKDNVLIDGSRAPYTFVASKM
jgi:hypothetical protein